MAIDICVGGRPDACHLGSNTPRLNWQAHSTRWTTKALFVACVVVCAQIADEDEAEGCVACCVCVVCVCGLCVCCNPCVCVCLFVCFVESVGLCGRGRIAQSVERSANNAVVLGSSPSMTKLFLFFLSFLSDTAQARSV